MADDAGDDPLADRREDREAVAERERKANEGGDAQVADGERDGGGAGAQQAAKEHTVHYESVPRLISHGSNPRYSARPWASKLPYMLVHVSCAPYVRRQLVWDNLT